MLTTILAIVVLVLVVLLVIENYQTYQLKKEVQNFRLGVGEITEGEMEKEKRKEEVLKLFQEDDQISNKEVVEELKVSRTSAFRYLEELEKEGRIKQVGKTGRFVYYSLK